MAKRFSYSIPYMTKRLLGMAAPAKGALAVSTLSSVVGNLAQMGAMGFGSLLLLRCAGWVPGYPALFGGLMILSAVLIVLGRYTEGVVSHAGAYKLLASMRVDLFQKIRTLSPACLIDRQKGELLNIAVSDIETVEFFFAHTIGPLFTVIILPCVTLGLALWFHPLYALALLPIYLVVRVVFPLAAIRAGRGVGMSYRARLGELKSLVLESVYGLRDLQIFGFGPRKLEEAEAKNRQINQAAHGLTLHRQTVSSAPTFFVYLARILVIGVASYLAAQGVPHPVGTVVLSFVAAASFSSTQSLTTVVSSLLETYAAAERLVLIEDTQPLVTEPAHPKTCGPIREISFRQVGFSYGGSPVLKNFSLSLSGSEKVGLMGESGAGKSTVLRLLLRFWDPQQGQILLNGIPLQELSLREVRQRIALLEQDTFLTSGSLGENIALSRPNATREEIAQAAREAGLEDFVSTLPQGYDTPMGEMGARLSGGERQRVGIARVLLANPDVIVMDEPTSSLDVLHEKELLRTLEESFGDKLLFLVSHRPSTLTICGRTVRLKDGHAVETHSDYPYKEEPYETC